MHHVQRNVEHLEVLLPEDRQTHLFKLGKPLDRTNTGHPLQHRGGLGLQRWTIIATGVHEPHGVEQWSSLFFVRQLGVRFFLFILAGRGVQSVLGQLNDRGDEIEKSLK